MSRPLSIKALVTVILALLLIVPLGAIQGIVSERSTLRRGVIANIQRSAVTPQTLVGPILVVPYRKTTIETTTDASGKPSTYTRHEDGQVRFIPDDLSITTAVETEHRSRGIYSALLYHTTNTLGASFTVPERFGVAELDSQVVSYAWGRAFLALGIADTRGIKGKLAARWNDGTATTVREFNGGTLTPIGNGVHAPIGLLPPSGGKYRAEIDLQLMGAESLQVVPIGKDTVVTMRAAWPHPSFIGEFLPQTRTITSDGFQAVWRTSRLASNIEHAMDQCDGKCARLLSTTLGVAFVQPVDVYLQTERSLKYGFLFIVITFVLFALYELLKRLAIHPVQYALVGVALAMFFLLLVALSEHLPFVVAYLAASASCVLLLGFYVSYVLKGVKRGASFATMLTLFYGAIYVLLQSEDMALVLGAILLFAILAAIMVVTRRVDWYRVTARQAEG